MALDKTALESLRIERDEGAEKYRERGGSRRRLWYVVAAVAVVAAVFGLVLLTGEPGIGKSRLAEHVAEIARSAARTAEAFRAGCGPDVGIMLDTNFHFKTEGFRRVAETVAPYDLTWLEIDQHDAPSLASIKAIASICPWRQTGHS